MYSQETMPSIVFILLGLIALLLLGEENITVAFRRLLRGLVVLFIVLAILFWLDTNGLSFLYWLETLL